MNSQVLKSLIYDHRDRFFSDKGLVSRDNLSGILSRLQKPEIEVITGVRRSGKSSLMKLISDDLIKCNHAFQDQILYINFDDERFIGFSVSDFDLLYQSYLELFESTDKHYFFLDEIQNVKGWERWINRIHESGKTKIFITGSNASLLEPEIGHHLTGRHRQTINWPFSFKEYLIFHEIEVKNEDLYQTERKITIKKYFNKFIKIGGFPEVFKQDDPELLEQYYRDILYRDIVARKGIRNIRELKELSLFLISNPGCIISYEKMQKMIGSRSFGTVKNFIEMLEEVFLIFRLPKFDYSVKKQIYNPGKFYVVDTGLFHSIGFSFSKNTGHLFENIVFIELQRRSNEVYYWKSDNGREVDFVCRRGIKITDAIQVCANMEDLKTREREFSGLIDAAQEINPERLLIITENEEGEEIIDHFKISLIPIWKWLVLE